MSFFFDGFFNEVEKLAASSRLPTVPSSPIKRLSAPRIGTIKMPSTPPAAKPNTLPAPTQGAAGLSTLPAPPKPAPKPAQKKQTLSEFSSSQSARRAASIAPGSSFQKSLSSIKGIGPAPEKQSDRAYDSFLTHKQRREQAANDHKSALSYMKKNKAVFGGLGKAPKDAGRAQWAAEGAHSKFMKSKQSDEKRFAHDFVGRSLASKKKGRKPPSYLKGSWKGSGPYFHEPTPNIFQEARMAKEDNEDMWDGNGDKAKKTTKKITPSSYSMGRGFRFKGLRTSV